MASNVNKALVLAKTEANAGLDALKSVIREISKVGSVKKISAVYRIQKEVEAVVRLGRQPRYSTSEGLVVALELETDYEPFEFFRKLMAAQQHQSEMQRSGVGLNFLAMENKTLSLPELSLPHPELHLRPEELVPANELWPNYFHPVLKKTIHELVLESKPKEWGEFFSQGNPLLDFSK